MRLVRFARRGVARWGELDGGRIWPIVGAPWEGIRRTEEGSLEVEDVALLPPAAPGCKVLCIGRNYRAHARELGNEVPVEPLVFLKPASALLPHGGTVLLPPESERVDYEGELALIVGRRARRVTAGAWRDVILGFAPALDMTARDLQKKDGQWWRAKGFDTFCPLGPAIETEGDGDGLLLETRVDGQTRQSARTSDFIFDLGTVVAWISAAVTLEPGDVLLTGTPEGVGPVAPGQTLEVEIERVGTLTVRTERES